jgi:hypothetical protein
MDNSAWRIRANNQMLETTRLLLSVVEDLHSRGCNFTSGSAGTLSQKPSIHLDGPEGLAGTGIVATEATGGAYGASEKRWFRGEYCGVELIWAVPREPKLPPVTITL